MASRFEIDDDVSWDAKGGIASGSIIRINTEDFDYNGRTLHATEDEPQYEIKNHKSDDIAVHKGSALTRISKEKD
jgi:hypothetical protein